MNNVNKELQTVVQKYTQNIVNNVNEDAFEKWGYLFEKRFDLVRRKKEEGRQTKKIWLVEERTTENNKYFERTV